METSVQAFQTGFTAVSEDGKPRFEFAGRRVAVIGLGRLSGVAAVKVLCRLGAKVLVNDARPRSELLPALEELQKDASVQVEEYLFGGHPASLADRVELMVLSPGVPYELPLLVAARAKGVPTIGEMELAYQLSRATFIAVTGTKGKTTTTTLLGRMLQAGLPVRVCIAGNIGIPVSLEVPKLGENDLVAVEVSSFQLESIVHFRPRVAVVNNISPDHLDRHGTMEVYIAAKRRIVENQEADDLLIVNQDDPIARSFAEGARAHVRGFSMTAPVTEGAYRRGEELVWRDEKGESVVATTADIAVPGRHNIANALAAVTVAVSLGVPREAIVETLRAFRGIEHAYESVRRVRGVHYIDDSKATNVASVRAALDATTEPGKVLLIMGGVDKGNVYDELFDPVREKVRRLILLGLDTRRLRSAFESVVPLSETTSMEQAVQIAAETAQPGDTVLMSPGHASFDLFQNWKERGDAFKQAVGRLD